LQEFGDARFDVIGTSSWDTAAHWFDQRNSRNLFAEFDVGYPATGTKASSLISAMARYSANGQGFNDVVAAQVPHDPAMPTQIAASLHA
jgi:hypothetical protein